MTSREPSRLPWARGLKLQVDFIILFMVASRLPWARGLKLLRMKTMEENISKVAPPVGAWIETTWVKANPNIGIVAPPVGAWIETYNYKMCDETHLSRLPWARGLKPRYAGSWGMV